MPIGLWLLAAVLGCWCVGAYNRLVRLRQPVAATFKAVAEALAARDRQAGAWLAATRPAAGEPALLASWQAAEAALRQAQAAADHASAGRRTADAPLLASLALADGLLRGALAQWAVAAAAVPAVTATATGGPVDEPDGAGQGGETSGADSGMGRAGERAEPDRALSTPVAEPVAAASVADAAAAVAVAETALGAARTVFNAAARDYNEALRQFPTRIVGWLFGFHTAGSL